MTADELLSLPPLEWEGAVSAMTIAERQTIERELDGIAILAGRAAGYVKRRHMLGNDYGHAVAWEEMQVSEEKIRQALGYTSGPMHRM